MALAKYTKDARIKQLKLMHELMRTANDEGIYETWIALGVPDEPQEDDFEFIAENSKEYNECFDLFAKLVKYSDIRY